jgi:hypothetical protein
MKSQVNFQRACAWSGIVCAVLLFGGLLAGGLIPLPSPDWSASQVASFYQGHATGIRFGSGLILLSGMFYLPYTAVMSAQMRRMKGVHPAAHYAQLASGSVVAVTFFLPAMLLAVTAFRPERSPDLTQLLNDMSLIILVIPWPPEMAQSFAFAFGILTDRAHPPAFPRWLAYLNIVASTTFVPGLALPFFKTGPLAWNGLVVFWIPAVAFGIQLIANAVMLLNAIRQEKDQASGTSRQGAGTTSAAGASGIDVVS